MLVFYPFAFSPVCTDQLQLYEPLLGGPGPTAACGSTASPATRRWSQDAFKEKLGVSSEQLSDFEPKGAACAAFGVLHPGGFPQRALVIIDADGVVRWSYQAASPGELPGAGAAAPAASSRHSATAQPPERAGESGLARPATEPADRSAKLACVRNEKKRTDRRPTGGTGRQ